jgi:protein SCO1/2
MAGSPGCARITEAISVRLDGEDPGMDVEVLEAHLARCEGCRRFQAGAGDLQRRFRVRVSEEVPDFRDRILAAIPDGPAPEAPRTGRRVPAPVLAVISLAAVLLVVVGYAAAGALRSGGSSSGQVASVQQVEGSDQANPRYPGATVYPPQAVVAKPDITLTDTSGQPFNPATATVGKTTLIYFGYTDCPDVCPLNMALTAAALRAMPAAERAKVTVVFITTDPQRDTGPVIREWLDKFDTGLPAFVGLYGDLDQIHDAERQVKMALSYAEPVQTGGGYDEVHAGYTLLYSRAGMADLQVDSTETVPEYATTLEHLVSSGFVRA